MQIPQELITSIGVCFLVSGFIKGFTGVGFLTICISSLIFFVDLKVAISLVFLSSIISNLFLMVDAGKFTQTAKQFWPLYILTVPGLALGINMLLSFDEKYILQALAAVIFAFCLFSLFRPSFRISPSTGRYLLMPVGFAHGVIAGLTGTQSVPLVPFVFSLRLETAQSLQAINTTLTVGTLMTGIIFYQQRIMTADLLFLSALCVVPTFLGVSIGNLLRKRVSASAFRTVTFVALLGIGVSLGWKSSGTDIKEFYMAIREPAMSHPPEPIMKLPPFRGQTNISVRGVHDGKVATFLSAGVPATTD